MGLFSTLGSSTAKSSDNLAAGGTKSIGNSARSAGTNTARESNTFAKQAATNAASKAEKEAVARAKLEAESRAKLEAKARAQQEAKAKAEKEATATDNVKKFNTNNQGVQKLENMPESTVTKVNSMSKMANWIKKNPKSAFAVGVVAAFGIAVVATATAMYEANNNKELKIVSMKPLDDANPTVVQITYSPDTKILKNDTIEFKDNADIVPTSIIKQSINIDKVVSDTQINVTIPSLTTPATTGSIILHTTFEDWLEQTASDIPSEVASTGTSIFDKLTSAVGPIFNWIIIGLCIIIGLPLLLFLFIKVIPKLFRF